jgi:hypothetical protein
MPFLLALPSTAAAQASDKLWGVGASFTPTWTGHEEMQNRLFWSDEDFPAYEGSEFTIGVVRGSMRGGDLSVSFVRKPIKDSTTVETSSQPLECSGSGNSSFCFGYEDSTSTEVRDMLVQGIEVTFFIPFARFADRIQIGVNAGGGAGFPTGTVTTTSVITSTFIQGNQPPQVETNVDTFEEDVTDEITSKIVPLVRLEAQAAIRLGRGLKVNIAGGLNAPSVAAFRFGVSYFFGAD